MRWNIQVKSAPHQVGVVTEEAFGSEDVFHFPSIRSACCDRGPVAARQVDVALAGMRRQIDDYQIELIFSQCPLDHHKVRGSWISWPRFTRLEQRGTASSDGSLLDLFEDFAVKARYFTLLRLQPSARQMNTEPLSRPCKLAFVEQAHSWQAEDNQRGGLLFRRGEKRRNTRLVVVFEEMGPASEELLGS